MDEEIPLEIPSIDPIGKIVVNKRQTGDRTSLPSYFWEHLDIEEGEDVMIVCKEDHIKLVKPENVDV